MLPNRNTVRDAAGAILWDLVDLFVGRLKHGGDMTVLSVQLGLSRATLHLRRVALGLPPLPKGRPPTVKLTERQEHIMAKLDEGISQAEIARELGVTPQAVADSAARAAAKRVVASSKACHTCGGSGIVNCNKCYGQGSHGHVCLDCGGDSTYWATKGVVL